MGNKLTAVDNERQAAELVAWSAAERQTLAVSGYDSKAGFGHTMHADHSLSLRALSGIVSYEPEELVMTARAGTPVAEIEAALAANRQYLPFEPPALHRLYERGDAASDDGAETAHSIGGVFMGNLSGPARFKNGAARDYLLGVKAINGRGEPYKSGGKVIKNVSGYDLSKLLAGSWGTLSVVTELSFKVLPSPETSCTIAIPTRSDAAAQMMFRQIQSAPYEVSGLAYVQENPSLLARRDSPAVLARLQGTAASIRARSRDLVESLVGLNEYAVLEEEATERIWRRLRDVNAFHDQTRTPVVLKLSIPPAAMVDVSNAIDLLGGCLWFADAGGAWLWVGVCSAAAEEKIVALQREACNHGGVAILYRASEAVKRRCAIFAGGDAALRRLNRRVKQSFDPLNLFNPGRLESLDEN